MIRVAVLGFGAFGKNHARVYSTLPDIELALIVDPDPARQAEARSLYPSARVAPHLEDAHVAAASIAVPTEKHVAVAEELLLQGIPCLVEKPIAPDLPAAQKLLTVSKNVGIPVYVGHLERFNPVMRDARPQIHDARFIEVHRLGSFSARSLDIDVVLDLMVHDLDLLLDIAGAFPERVEAIGVEVLTGKVDIANARLTFPSGLVANVTASRVSKERIRKLRIFQPHCYMSLDFAKRSYEVYQVAPPSAEDQHPVVTAREITPPEEEPLRAELSAFLRAVVEGERSPILATADQGAEALRLALMVVERMRDSRS